MTPHQYAYEIVFPTVRAFLAARHDRRLAYLACLSTYHLVDHIARADRLEKWRVCDEMRLACATDFEVIQGISEGSRRSENGEADAQFVVGPMAEIASGGFGMGRFAVDPRTAPTAATDRLPVHTCVVAVLKHFAQRYPHHFNAPDQPG